MTCVIIINTFYTILGSFFSAKEAIKPFWQKSSIMVQESMLGEGNWRNLMLLTDLAYVLSLE